MNAGEGRAAADAVGSASCPRCQVPVEPPGRFCQVCGTRIDDTETASGPVTRQVDRTATARSAAPAVAEGGQRCPNCGAVNRSERELCGRCGADLGSGIIPPLPRPPAAEPTNRRRRVGRGMRRVWWAWPVAVLGVAAGVTAGLMLAEVGPFERTPELPSVVFEPERYPGEPAPLVLSDVATMTTLPPEGTETYVATHMVDDDPLTAWRSDGSRFPDGIGETIDLFLAQPAWIDAIVLVNGFQRDSETYAASARLKRAQVTLDGDVAFVVNLLDQGLQPQIVELREPALTTSLRIEVLETFPGEVGDDLAISDIEVRGWRADAADAEQAEERAELRPAGGTAVAVEPRAERSRDGQSS